MRARLERGVDRGTACRLSGARQRFDLGMRPSTGLGPAPRHDHRTVRLMAHDHGADGGIGPGISEAATAERQRQRHEAGVDGRIDLD